MSRLSLRVRVLVIALALSAVGVLTVQAVVVGVLRAHLVDRVDAQLTLIGGLFARLPVTSPSGVLPRELTVQLDLVREVYIARLSPAGDLVAEMGTPGAGAGPRLSRLDAAAVAARGTRPFDADGWRVVTGAAAEGGSVVVAVPLSEVDSTVRRMWTVGILTTLAVLAALALLGFFLVNAGLRPLRRIEETAAAIAGGDLSHRVPVLAGPRTEVGRLSVALNGMLGQLEGAFAARTAAEARMRVFLGDVSHELRTPLFGIKGFTELYRMGGLPERADVDRTMAHIEREATRLASLAEDLLLLARLDQQPDAIAPTPMDLRTLAADALGDLRALDPTRPVELTGPAGGAPGRAPVLGDEARLRQVITNLVGNAVTHTPAGTPVRIGVGTAHGHAVLELADRGPGLAPEQAARVFDRFYRADRSRHREDGAGAGLGLSIVRSLVEAHGGTVTLETGPGEGATFRVLLPILREAPGESVVAPA
ncbi:two-component sensor histidine kinase [Virgisporangium aliadipatigenens]|uniref:histidine kinase n=1 Tax=Virgisporangium aliadipatigenens TaxID=741659 RepID=A0A8J3YUV4_9ACTN|nr:HAMP domain-containing sensor histidine kinase [Virgisporangium aliadipatigenens]GIJ52109.1 two-component sensor histidine kinase [Virgisporangium aliadipatigenens]